jgi:hypothetical protein
MMEKKRLLDKQSFIVMGICFTIIPMLSDIVWGKVALIALGLVYLVVAFISKAETNK